MAKSAVTMLFFLRIDEKVNKRIKRLFEFQPSGYRGSRPTSFSVLFPAGDSNRVARDNLKTDTAMKLQIKRAYDAPAKTDGTRILVDRLWPRGLSRDKAAVDLWLKEIAPSTELRQWYAHEPERWPEFRRRYFAELDGHPEIVAELRAALDRKSATLVCAAKDAEHSNARALLEYLQR